MSRQSSQRTGPRLSSNATRTIVARALGGFAVLLLLQATGSILNQLALTDLWWKIVFLGGTLLSIVALCALSVRGRGTFVPATALAGLTLVGLAFWPTSVTLAGNVDVGAPWPWAFVTLATACCCYVFGTLAGTAYAVLIGSVFTLVRLSPSGGGASLLNALEDTAYATVVGLIVVVALGVMRQAASKVDDSAEHLIRQYGLAADELAVSNERLRMDGILHDLVMTSLITAAQSESPLERQASASLAAEAMEQLHAAPSAAGADSQPVSAHDISTRIRFLSRSMNSVPAVAVSLRSGPEVLIPSPVANALLRSAGEALRNSVEHSRASRRWVVVNARETNGAVHVEVTISDNGVGFDPSLVSDRRLGIAVSIVGRAESVGARASVSSAPQRGTVVELGWSGRHE